MINANRRQDLEEKVNLELLTQLSRRNQQLKLVRDQLSSMEARLAKERDQLSSQIAEYQNERDQLKSQLAAIHATRAWKTVLLFYAMWRWTKNLIKSAYTFPFRCLLAIYQALIPGNHRATIRRFLGIDSRRPMKYEPQRQFEEIEVTLAELGGILDRKELHARQDYIILSIIEMEARFQRPQQMAVHLARQGHRVFYLSSSKFISTTDTEPYRIKELAPLLYEVLLPIDKQPNIYGETIDPKTQEIIVAAIRSFAEDHGIYTAVQLVQLPFWTDLALKLRDLFGWKMVYDCMDEWEGFPGIKSEILKSEKQLVKTSDLVIVTSAILYDKWYPSANNCVLVRNAVNFELFNQGVRPNEILGDDIKHPIIGYYGAIAEWVDLELIEFLAAQHPEWNLVILGDIFIDVTNLKSLPNIHLLGRKPHKEMPLYLYHFDVCIIPFEISDVTNAVDPVKLYEYLSAGKPVVASRITELLHYEDYLYLAATHDEFLHKVERALLESDIAAEERRIELARQNTWDSRIEQLNGSLKPLYAKFNIIVVTYQNVSLTRQCIESILRNTDYPNYEIIVVDNFSSDGTRSYLRYLARTEERITVILNNENRGFAAANNQALRASSGDRIVLLNNDTVVPRGWLTGLSSYLDDPEIGLVGPVTNFAGNEARIPADYKDLVDMEKFADKWMRTHKNDYFDIKVLAMYCVAMRRDLVNEIGVIDEQFGTGLFEDDDYSKRVKQAGYRVVCAQDVFVHHYGQAAFKLLQESGEYQDLWERNQAYFERKWQTAWESHKPR